MFVLTIFLVFCTVGLVGYSILPAIYGRLAIASEKRQQRFSNRMEQLIPRQEAKRMSRLFVIAPLILGAGFYMLFPEGMQLFGVIFGFVAGLIFPGIYVQTLARKTKEKFGSQLVDALMIMSSSFRGGLKFGPGSGSGRR